MPFSSLIRFAPPGLAAVSAAFATALLAAGTVDGFIMHGSTPAVLALLIGSMMVFALATALARRSAQAATVAAVQTPGTAASAMEPANPAAPAAPVAPLPAQVVAVAPPAQALTPVMSPVPPVQKPVTMAETPRLPAPGQHLVLFDHTVGDLLLAALAEQPALAGQLLTQTLVRSGHSGTGIAPTLQDPA